MLGPWVFGDEYIYISKARNLARGIDVIADASLGHTYPPLYSYLIAPAITSTASQSYSLIQLTNIITTLVIFGVAFWILNEVFSFTSSKRGTFFLIFSYLMTITLPLITGYWPVAMSENLYTPLIALIFSLFTYFNYSALKKQQSSISTWLQLILISVISAAAILSRSIGLTLLPALVLALAWLEWVCWSSNSAEQRTPFKRLLIHIILKSVAITGLTYSLVKLFTTVESSFIQHTVQATLQHQYSSSPYIKVITDLLLNGQNNLAASFKVLGNHSIYLFFSSLMIPLLFYLNELLHPLHDKSKFQNWLRHLSPEFVFLTALTIFSMGLSYLHTYLGFQANPIKYSTYFRYMDPTIAMWFIYGLIHLWKLLSGKIELHRLSLLVFSLTTFFLTLMLPARDFYISINATGWGWLDLFQQQHLIKPTIIIFTGLATFIITSQRRLLPFLVAIILGMNLTTLRHGYLNMHRWQAGIYKDALDEVLEEIIMRQDLHNIYLVDDFSQTDHSQLYYLKYRLLFINDEFVPIPFVNWNTEREYLISSGEPFGLIDENGILYEEATESYLLGDKWQMNVFNL